MKKSDNISEAIKNIPPAVGIYEYYDKNDDNIIKKFFPNSKISLIRNASHWLHVENPKDFFNEIKSWI